VPKNDAEELSIGAGGVILLLGNAGTARAWEEIGQRWKAKKIKIRPVFGIEVTTDGLPGNPSAAKKSGERVSVHRRHPFFFRRGNRKSKARG